MQISETTSDTNDHIFQAFQHLLSERKQVGSKIATKQEAVQREEDKQVVERASTYTVDSIVKGLADLQLNFGHAVEGLAEKLAGEAPKLDELRRAIRVETEHLAELRQIRIAADALDILIQEHQNVLSAFEETSQQARQALDTEIAEEKQVWQKEQTEWDAALKKHQEFVKKGREQRETDYRYELERKRKIEADEYADRKAALERQIVEEDAKKGEDWTEREKVLAEQQEICEKYKTLVESFPQEQQEAIRTAREEAINEIYEDARVQAELFEKEAAANKEISELKIASLKETVVHQANQIDHLSTQLQSVLQQGQDLAVKAVEHTRKSHRSDHGEIE